MKNDLIIYFEYGQIINMLKKDLNKKNQEDIISWAKEFHLNYTYNSFFDFKVDKNMRLGEKNKFICRFCGKDKNDTKFKKKAHVAPKLIGNIFVTSYYECDSCNSIFSKYETDLAHYIGLRRYFKSNSNSDNFKRIIYKSENGRSLVYTSGRGVEISDLSKNIFDVIDEGKVYKSKINKLAYTPLNVYKSLVKIIISILTEDALLHFKKSTKFLISDIYDDNKYIKWYSNVAKIDVSDLFVDYPLIYTYIKRKEIKKYEIDNNIHIPDKTFIIFFLNFIYQIFIPFDICDNIDGKKNCKILLPLYPPIITLYKKNKSIIFNNYTHKVKDLSSKEKIKDEKDEFYIISKSESYLLKYTKKEYEDLSKKYNLIHKKF